MQSFRIMVLDRTPELSFGRTLFRILKTHPGARNQLNSLYMPCEASSALICDRVLEAHPDIVLLTGSYNALSQTGPLVRGLVAEPYHLPVVAVSEEKEQDRLFDLLKLGVRDYIATPISPDNLFSIIWKLLDQRSEQGTQSHMMKERFGLKQLIGESPVFLNEIRNIPILARCDSSILVAGETGTGKELVARTIHYLSTRAGKPFIPVNCGAIPSDLIENELFGHSRGAYTGADSSQTGLVHEAEGGTIFLDEIDSLPTDIQVKLLRLLQEKEYRRLGSPKVLYANIRTVTASNADLEQLVKEGKFRRDLYYRLNVFQLTLPPLRQRKEDIPILAHHFLPIHAATHDCKCTGFTDTALSKLMFYDWPGNVRELENAIERAVVFSGQETITHDDITLPGQNSGIANEPFHVLKARVLDEFERDYVKIMLRVNHGNITKAALAAQKSRRGFWELIRKHGIDVNYYKNPTA